MKTPTYILVLLLLFVLPLLSKAQNDSIVLNKEAPSYKNQIDFGVQFLGVDFLYKYRVGKKIFIGGGIGGGFLGQIGLNNDGVIEMIKVMGLADYYSSFCHLQSYIKYSVILTGDGEGGGAAGGGAGVYFSLGKIELGTEISILYRNISDGITSKYGKGRVVSSLLILRIPLKKW